MTMLPAKKQMLAHDSVSRLYILIKALNIKGHDHMMTFYWGTYTDRIFKKRKL
jgi:hypothetical protein